MKDTTPSMIQIDDKIINTDILTTRFCCDLTRCKGVCCVEGNAGAPLELDEVDLLEEQYEAYRPYLKPEGEAALEEQGFMVVDTDGDYTTPLIGEAECAYSFSENGITFCAIERAHREGKCSFPKPISCHLYPIRVMTFNDGTVGLNYHRWNICCDALQKGRAEGVPMYRMLKAPLIRRFGEPFFTALIQAEEMLGQHEQQANL